MRHLPKHYCAPWQPSESTAQMVFPGKGHCYSSLHHHHHPTGIESNHNCQRFHRVAYSDNIIIIWYIHYQNLMGIRQVLPLYLRSIWTYIYVVCHPIVVHQVDYQHNHLHRQVNLYQYRHTNHLHQPPSRSESSEKRSSLLHRLIHQQVFGQTSTLFMTPSPSSSN